MKNDEFKFDEVVYNEFLKLDVKEQEYYGLYLIAQQKKEELFKKLPNELQTAFNELISAREDYESESYKGFARFVVRFIRNIF